MLFKKISPLRFFKNYFFPIILIAFAVCYYGSYYRCSLYPSGEGGAEGVTALRLMMGQTPIVDVALNYNLLWFYPIVWLFKIVGPSYTALRIFFFAVATLTGLLVFWIVQATTRHRRLALLAGLLALLLPGQLFRNYMAFTVVLNMALFLKTFLLPPRDVKKQLLWMAATGCSLGLTLLIRIDLGFFLSAVFLGLVIFSPWINNSATPTFFSFKNRCCRALATLFLGVAGILLVHLPFVIHAEQKGFAAPFLAQYEQWPHMIGSQASHLIQALLRHKTISPASISYASVTSTPSVPNTPKSALTPTITKSNLLRPSLDSTSVRERMTTLNIYLPILCTLLLLFLAALFLIVGKIKKELRFEEGAWIFLIMLGCALTLFPQYFFWRPDMVHLSEFMVPMTPTLLVAISFTWGMRKKVVCVLGFFLFLFLFLASLTLALYFINGCQSQSTGGIAISQGRTKEFVAANNVRVKLAPHEWEEATAITRSILGHSKPGDYVICYPYNPEINFMTDRPSYRRDLYIDDMTAPKDFDQKTIAELEHYQPAAIVVIDWPINGTEHSRFSHWAAETYHYIQNHYQADFERGIIHVFVRPQK